MYQVTAEYQPNAHKLQFDHKTATIATILQLSKTLGAFCPPIGKIRLILN